MVPSYLSKTGTKSVLPVPTNVDLPYPHLGRDVLCSNAPSECVVSSKSFNAAQHASTAIVKYSIPKCGKIFSIKDIRHHVAHHIIHDPMLASKLGIDFSPLLLCGMCGSYQALTYTADSPADGCPSWLDPRKKL
eukprot:12012877-Ditylum_brightwellii.AAC.1